MAQIFKIARMGSARVEKIYIFIGSRVSKDVTGEELSRQYNDNPGLDIFRDIFTDEEKEDIREEETPLVFINKTIHEDDTVETIKKKIMLGISLDIELTFGELYLFCLERIEFDPLIVYQSITQNGTLEFTRPRYMQFLLNIGYDGDIQQKEIYTYEDILSLDLKNRTFNVKKPIGQYLSAFGKPYEYTVNPFDVIVNDKIVRMHADDFMTTTNKNLLMNETNVLDNFIYICLAKDVLEFAETETLDSNEMVSIYYPYLSNSKYNIVDKETLDAAEDQLRESEKGLINEAFIKKIDDVDMFYSIHERLEHQVAYNKIGLSKLDCILKPRDKFILPLDIVFKLIHATETLPLIKYNPGKRKENIYRLYTNSKAVNGKQIPYLEKGTIFRLMKIMGTEKSVSLYLTTDDKTVMICEINIRGEINIKARFINIVEIDMIDDMLRKIMNPVIDDINSFLSKSGYSISRYESIKSKNISIIDSDMEFNINIKKQFNFADTIAGCVSSIFSVNNADLAEGIVMRFKRVGNYSEMDAQEAFITDDIDKKIPPEIILQRLQENFGMDEKEAKKVFSTFLISYDVTANAFRNRKLKTKHNPGFLVKIDRKNYTKELIVTISGINEIDYFKTIPIYIDTLFKLVEYSEHYKDDIETLCKRSEVEDNVVIEDSVMEDSGESDDKPVDAIDPGEIVFGDSISSDMSDEGEDDIFGLVDSDDDEDGEDEDGEDEDGEDEDGEDEDGEDEDGEGTTYKGGNSKKKTSKGKAKGKESDEKVDITGMSLNNPNPFSEKMDNKDPSLFVYDGDENYNAYSRVCPWNVRRQPVILTDEEKQNIDKNHAGSYDEAIEYGSSKEKKHWYICPRYWSLRDNVSLTQEQVDSGKYGSIIPHNAKKVPKGANIFEFNHQKEHKGADGSYIKHYPGFLKKTNPDGKCLPCCFKTWSGKSQVERRLTCENEMKHMQKSDAKKSDAKKSDAKKSDAKKADAKKADAKKSDAKKADAKKADAKKADAKKSNESKDKEGKEEIPKKLQMDEIVDDYIIAENKFPIEQGRFGYLPMSIQKFLRTDNSKCKTAEKKLKQDTPCLLRVGVQLSQTQSFISCIASIWQEQEKGGPVTIKKMKQHIIDMLTLDKFMTLQNGILVETFGNFNDIPDVDIDSYKDTKLYKSTDAEDEGQMVFLKRVVNAYTNFIAFLNNDSIVIDYKYLWDIVCVPKNLFAGGLNMVILERKDDDITDNIQVICPTNHYSRAFFNAKLPIIILIKRGNYYEPICQYKETDKSYEVRKRFHLDERNMIDGLEDVLQIIKISMNENCFPLPSMSRKVYSFKQNITLEDLLHRLKKRDDIIIHSQILNYNGKIIAVNVTHSPDGLELVGNIPCYPSAPILDLPYVWLDDIEVYDYEKTRDFLEHISEEFSKKIPCKPIIKVKEDGLIVGIITETNQFLMVTPVADNSGDGLSVVDEYDFLKTDKTAITNDSIDTERVKFIKNIRFESEFYKIFRNTVKLLLDDYTYREIREEIEKTIDSPIMLYYDKLDKIVIMLKNLTKKSLKFVTYNAGILDSINEITGCSTDGKCKNTKYCFTDRENCLLLIPRNNLINDNDNKKIYYGRLADELIRYNRIRSFMLDPKAFLTFENIKYNLREDEIILLQSLLTQEYFEDIEINNENKYVKQDSYDTVEPMQTIPYSNKVSIEKKQKIVLLKEKEKEKETDKEPDLDSSKITSKSSISSINEATDSIKMESPKKVGMLNLSDDCPSAIEYEIPKKWKSSFPRTTTAIEYRKGETICTYNLIISLIDNLTGEKKTKTNLQEILIEAYITYSSNDKYFNNIINIWKAQGKIKLVSMLSSKDEFKNIIYSDEYYLTNIDIWILSVGYNLPIILISGTRLRENMLFDIVDKHQDILVLNSTEEDDYYFIHPSGIINNVPPVYRLFVINKDPQISNMIISPELQEYIDKTKGIVQLDKFIENGDKLRKNKKAKKIKLIIKD